MRKIIVFASLLVAAMTTSAQKFKSTIVILNSGDSLKGEVNPNSVHPEDFELRNATGQLTKYTPGTVAAFYIPGEFYYESISITENGQTRPVFMNLLVAGPADLFDYGGRFFIRDVTGSMAELIQEIAKKEIDGKEYAVYVEKYKQLLASKFANCPEAVNDVKRTALTRNALMRLFNKYNKCLGPEIESLPKVQRTRAAIYGGLEYGWIQDQITRIAPFAMDESTFQDKYSQSMPGINIQYFFRVPRALSVNISLYRSDHSYWSSVVFKLKGDPYDNWKFRYDMSFQRLTIPIIGRVTLLKDRLIQPFLGVGADISFNQNFKGTRQAWDNMGIDRGKNGGNLSHFFRNNTISLVSQAGVNIKLRSFLIGGFVHYEFANSPLVFTTISSPALIHATQMRTGATMSVSYAFVK